MLGAGRCTVGVVVVMVPLMLLLLSRVSGVLVVFAREWTSDKG